VKEGQHIDDLFKDQLKDYELEAPMHLWNAVAEAVPVESNTGKRRKGLIWWFALVSLTLLGVLLAWWYFDQEPVDIEVSNFPVALVDVDKTIANLASDNEDKRITADKTTLLQEVSSSSQEILPPVSIPETSAALTAPEAKTIIAALLQEEPTRSEAEEEPSPSLPENQMIEAETNSRSNFRLDLLQAKGAELAYVPPADSLTFSLPKERSWRTTIDVMASMDFVLRNLEAKESAYAAYAKRRDDTETFRHGTSVGMRLSTVSDNGFAVRSGLNYSTINEQLNLKIGEEERLIAQIKYAEDGSIIGADTTLATVGLYRIVNNRYTELDIPLLVGYEYSGQKVSLSFNGGIHINMLSAQRGEFLSPNTDESVSFSSSDPNSYRAFRNRLGIGFYGSMGVYFQVNDNLQFLLEPYLKWRPGSYTVDAYVLDQRHTTAGLFVGMRKEIY
jgi:hypothetical protein